MEYQWGHMGQCNAGHLIQTITGMSSYEIVKSIDFQLIVCPSMPQTTAQKLVVRWMIFF